MVTDTGEGTHSDAGRKWFEKAMREKRERQAELARRIFWPPKDDDGDDAA